MFIWKKIKTKISKKELLSRISDGTEIYNQWTVFFGDITAKLNISEDQNLDISVKGPLIFRLWRVKVKLVESDGKSTIKFTLFPSYLYSILFAAGFLYVMGSSLIFAINYNYPDLVTQALIQFPIGLILVLLMAEVYLNWVGKKLKTTIIHNLQE